MKDPQIINKTRITSQQHFSPNCGAYLGPQTLFEVLIHTQAIETPQLVE